MVINKEDFIMNYLYLDFAFNLNNGGENWDDYFSTSLIKQYANIYKKVGHTTKPTENDLSRFINICFNPMEQKNYYFSMPAFNRDPEIDKKKGNKLYRNIIIRPEKTSLMNDFLPKGQDLILIGDIKSLGEQSLGTKMFVVKGIETINEVKSNKYELPIIACSKNAFNQREINNWIGETYRNNFGINSAINNNLILKLVEVPYYIKEVNYVLNKYQDWKEYINFRKYYLEEQSKRSMEFSNCELLHTFVVPKQIYRMKEEKLKNLLLDEYFSRDEQVVLTKNIENSEPFPLVKIEVDYNKKLLYSNI